MKRFVILDSEDATAIAHTNKYLSLAKGNTPDNLFRYIAVDAYTGEVLSEEAILWE